MTVSLRAVRVMPSQEYGGQLTALPTFDNTKLVAINTCPLWGIVRYTHHKVMNAPAGRSMALEAGGAAHEVFAAHRLYTFREFGPSFYEVTDTDSIERAFVYNGERIFGRQRFAEMLGAVDSREDFRSRCQQFSLTALFNSGFYDDPFDKKRTTTNIEEMCIAYMDKFDWSDQLPYWDGALFLGIEQPVDVVVRLSYGDNDGNSKQIDIRFIGKADGLHYTSTGRDTLRIHENKTASRLGDAWEMSWETNHQPTGYMIALTAILSLPISKALMLGTALPLPKSYSVNGIARVVVNREKWQFEEWFKWLLHTTMIHEEYKDDPTNAPQYTHSCNRYFRPCAYVPLCATSPDERPDFFADMVEAEWNPLTPTQEMTDE